MSGKLVKMQPFFKGLNMSYESIRCKKKIMKMEHM